VTERHGTGRFYLALAAITLLATALRLLWLDQATFAFDQAQIALRALTMARLGRLAAVGTEASVGIPHLPGTIWCYAVLYRLTTDPLLITGAVALINGGSVAGLGLVGRRAFGPAGGLIAAALYGLSPWAILFSRVIWGPDLVPALAVLWAYAAFRAQTGERPWPWVALCLMAAGLATQVHYVAVALLPATLYALIAGRWWARGRWPGLALGAGAVLLSVVPFVGAVWPEREAMLATMRTAGPGWRLSTVAAEGVLQMASGLEWPVIAVGQPAAALGGAWAAQRATAWVLLGAFVGGMLLLLWRALRRASGGRGDAGHGDAGRPFAAPFVLLWVLATPLLYSVHSTPVHHHYLLAALPGLHLATASLAPALSKRRGGRVLLALLVALALAQGGYWVAGLARQRPAAAAEIYSMGFQRQVLAALPDEGPVVLAVDCDAHEVCDEAAVWEARLWGRAHRIVDGRHVLLIPAEAEEAGATLLLSASSGDLYAGWGHGAEPVAEVAPYRIARLPAGWRTSLAGWNAVEPRTLETGARLEAWRTEEAGGRLRLWLLWGITAEALPGQIQQFTHAYDGEARVAGEDFPVSARAWRVGDTLVTWADLAVPEGHGALSFRVGQYDLATMERAAILEQPEDPDRAIVLGP